LVRPHRTEDELLEAAVAVDYEWVAMAELARNLDGVIGVRTEADNNAMEAFLVHYRCMVNFLCGDYKGNWYPTDIQPEDFLGEPWWPQDEELDRRMRGRLPIINTELQHLSWQRVTNRDAVKWSTVSMAHEVSFAAERFVDEAERVRPGRVAANLRITTQHVGAVLPPVEQLPHTEVPPAPARRS
jgi:hypothetical protein